MRHQLTDLKLVGTEDLDDFPGQQFYHLSAGAPGEPLAQITDGMMGRGRLAFDLWIDTATYHVTRVRVVEPETDPKDPTVWVMDLERFNVPVDIKAPIP